MEGGNESEPLKRLKLGQRKTNAGLVLEKRIQDGRIERIEVGGVPIHMVEHWGGVEINSQ